MTARAALHTLVANDSGLLALGVSGVYAADSLDTPPGELFAVIRWLPTRPVFKSTGADQVAIWIHDTQRDYGRINDALHRLRQIVPEAVHLLGGDGWRLTCAEWAGESGDLFDAGYETCTRYVEFTVISSRVGA